MTDPTPTTVKNERGVWYLIVGDYCLLCGRSDEERVRMPPPKPERWEDRHEITDTACSGHFL